MFMVTVIFFHLNEKKKNLCCVSVGFAAYKKCVMIFHFFSYSFVIHVCMRYCLSAATGRPESKQ